MLDSPTLRPLTPEDAPGLKDCFERCYGPSYVAGYFYDIEALRERITSGRLRSIVAVSDSGEIVGHMGLTVRHPGAQTVDAGNTIVDPRFRGRQLVGKLGMSLSMLCRDQGFFGYHHYPTTIHPIMQKLSVSSGGVETGIMLGYIPAGTEYRAIEGDPLEERLAVTVVYQPLNPAPARSIHVPDSYADLIRPMIEAAKLERSMESSRKTQAPTGKAVLELIDDPRRGLLRLKVSESGPDLGGQVETVLAKTSAEAVQLDLPLSSSATLPLLETLRSLGFIFCAYLPEYLDGDVLRLQHLRDRMPQQPNLENAGAQGIFEFIRREIESLSD